MTKKAPVHTFPPGEAPLPAGWFLRCHECRREPSSTIPDYCRHCGFPIEAARTGPGEPGAAVAPTGAEEAAGIWRFADSLPVSAPVPELSLGEGNTPVVSAPRTAGRLGFATGSLLAKLESHNPSGSFKDRAVITGVARALESGAPAVVCASTGNAAGSAATYAARAGLPCVIVVSDRVPRSKLSACMGHGAHVVTVDGDYSAAFQLGRELAHEHGWTNLATTYVNPFGCAGLRTIACELAEQLPEPPDWIMVPVGAGPLLREVYAGYRELHARRLVSKVPRLVAVQAAECAPIVTAFEAGAAYVDTWDGATGDISGLNDALRGYPADGTVTLRAVRDSNGWAVAVAAGDVYATARTLAREDGIFVEPASAAAATAAGQLRSAGRIGRDERVVCLLTGHGLKEFAPGEAAPGTSADIAAPVRSVLERLGAGDANQESRDG